MGTRAESAYMPLPFRRILCPIDFSDNSLDALDIAASIVRGNAGVLFVLHVVPMAIPPTGMPPYVSIYDEEEAAKQRLNEIAGQRLAGLKHELLIQLGEPARRIVDCMKAKAADLVVTGTHGRRGMSHVLLGSVAEFVVRRAACPVLVIRQAHKEKNPLGHTTAPQSGHG